MQERGAVVNEWSVGAFASGLLLATLTSAGIVATRMSAGNAVVALAANAFATLAAIAVAAYYLRAQSDSFARGLDAQVALPALPRTASQIIGAIVGVALVHLALRASGVGSSHELVERPAQLVNDAVAVLAILCLVWGAASRPANLLRVVVGAAVILLYVATATRWHLDPIAFHGPTVQQLVALEFTGAAIGIAVFRSLAPSAI
jgi:hypothetical protein